MKLLYVAFVLLTIFAIALGVALPAKRKQVEKRQYEGDYYPYPCDYYYTDGCIDDGADVIIDNTIIYEQK
ncbi:hypothetical protein QR680_013835 [Steinernema hermaphroditum]|uniref:Uncharacterized protein n=1 Tax=Steinernema hermaphroditum TaxID=289476 RepID=A0AA39M315_9BILA|nr:hypothetical protein QR680_013835 [Steinernema hermaphroditum]